MAEPIFRWPANAYRQVQEGTSSSGRFKAREQADAGGPVQDRGAPRKGRAPGAFRKRAWAFLVGAGVRVAPGAAHGGQRYCWSNYGGADRDERGHHRLGSRSGGACRGRSYYGQGLISIVSRNAEKNAPSDGYRLGAKGKGFGSFVTAICGGWNQALQARPCPVAADCLAQEWFPPVPLPPHWLPAESSRKKSTVDWLPPSRTSKTDE